ncbi:FKBP-type peptidyl-prolyl cis-trans isomerase [Gynurincola endophyticus]|uniref:FKBP-type peptidyl-prolyl cis-trans isomerase n=1 Tax=Gynurincola endophyticus TaxID=2479004 RepID=UPI000F8EFDDA|nr:FKBP-type peptidyl-prolyl cis-trans isomerase [Gynurincola endophyticus]
MKNFVLLIVGLCMFTVSQAQKKSGSKKNKKTQTVEIPQLKNRVDSFSYAVGISIAGFYKAQGVDSIDINSVVMALNDTKATATKLTEEEANAALMGYINDMKAEKSKANKQKGTDFLEKNKANPNVKVTESGLQYEVIVAGTGEKPTISDKVKVHYIGTLVDGKEFDNSHKRGQPLDLRVNGVIKGWTEALLMMPKGSKWKIYIPSELGYGDQQAGQDILPGSALVFEIELIDIVR